MSKMPFFFINFFGIRLAQGGEGRFFFIRELMADRHRAK